MTRSSAGLRAATFNGGILMAATVCASALVSGCGTYASRLGQPDSLYTPIKNSNPLDDSVCAKREISEHDKFYCADEKVRKAETLDSGDVRGPASALLNARQNYFDSGVAYSQQLCDEWFNTLELTRKRVENEQGTTKILGSLTLTSMGIFRSAADHIAAASAVFGASDAWFNLSKATFLLTPDVGKLQAVTRQGQNDLVTRVRAAYPSAPYGQLKQFLQQHHQLCSLQELQRVVNDAVGLAKYEISLPGDLSAVENTQLSLLSEKVEAAISGHTPGSPIGVDDLRKLYYYVMFGVAPTTPSTFLTNLTAKVDDLVLKAPNESAAAVALYEIRRLLAAIGTVAKYSPNPPAGAAPQPQGGLRLNIASGK